MGVAAAVLRLAGRSHTPLMPPKKSSKNPTPAPAGTPLVITLDDIRAAVAGLTVEAKQEFVTGLSTELAQSLREIGRTCTASGIKREDILPPSGIMFRAFETPNPRVVILGQDPYHNGAADGLAFSSAGPPERSLANIFECLRTCGLMTSKPATGNLTEWHRQGVMLLNTAFTVQRGVAGSFMQEWSGYFSAVIRALATRKERLIFIMLGAAAQSHIPAIRKIADQRHMILTWAHPSPANAKSNFKNCDVFMKANADLVSRGAVPINWDTVNSAEKVIAAAAAGAVRAGTTPKKSLQQPPSDFRDDWNDEPEDEKKIKVTHISGPRTICEADLVAEETAFIFTDGAARANGGDDCQAGAAFLIESSVNRAVRMRAFPRELNKEGTAVGDDPKTIDQYLSSCIHMAARLAGARPTNNRAELLAIFEAMKLIDGLVSVEVVGAAAAPKKTFVIVSDSHYSLMSISSRWDPAKKNGGQPKQNLDIIDPAIELYKKLGARLNLIFTHVTGHSVPFANETPMQTYLRVGNSIVDRTSGAAAIDPAAKELAAPPSDAPPPRRPRGGRGGA